MKKDNISLTPAEILVVLNRKTKVQDLIKITFYDLLIRGLLKVNKLETTTSEYEFFITFFSNKKGEIKYHEEIFFNVLSKEEGVISLKELAFELSNYNNEKFRNVMSQYNYEEAVLKSLLESRVYKSLKKRFLLVFRRSALIFTSEGLEIRSVLKSVRDDYPDNWAFFVDNYYKKNSEFFETKFFLALKSDFVSYFWDGKKRRHIGMTYSERGNYPKPAINTIHGISKGQKR